MTADSEITLRQLQDEQRPWVARNFPGRPSWYPLLGVMEEVGELAHAHLKGEQGIRYTPDEVRAKKVDAVADIVTFLADYCSAEAIDLQAAIDKTWPEVRERDWAGDPTKGGRGDL